jgi:hypothetical protein
LYYIVLPKKIVVMKHCFYALCYLPLTLGSPLDKAKPELEGRWKPERFERVTYSPEGKVLRKQAQKPDSTTLKELIITRQRITFDSPEYSAPISQAYTRQADTLVLRLKPDSSIMRLVVKHLDAHKLTLRLIETQSIGPRHYRSNADTFLVRQE